MLRAFGFLGYATCISPSAVHQPPAAASQQGFYTTAVACRCMARVQRLHVHRCPCTHCALCQGCLDSLLGFRQRLSKGRKALVVLRAHASQDGQLLAAAANKAATGNSRSRCSRANRCRMAAARTPPRPGPSRYSCSSQLRGTQQAQHCNTCWYEVSVENSSFLVKPVMYVGV